MEETISVRIPKEELRMINEASKFVKRKRSDILREILEFGVKQMMLEIALGKFQKNEATASKAAKIAGIPLTLFLDVLAERKINFHYTLNDLKEDTEDLI